MGKTSAPPFRSAFALREATVLAAACLSLVLTGRLAAQGQTRSDVARPSSVDKRDATGRLVFAGVGINGYHVPDLWKTLDNAVNDVTGARDALIEQYGFESQPDWVLLDDQASRQSILALVDELRQSLQPNDSLVFFFAGHGTETRDMIGGDEVGRTGYLVPFDVKGPVSLVPSQYIRIEDILKDLARVPARHVLVVLDSCRSGLGLQASVKTRGDGEPQAVDSLVSRVSRRVLTSAQSDQEARDQGQTTPKNSLFTGWLLSGLGHAARGESPNPDDGDRDGFMTSSELFSYVRGRVAAESESRQTPDFGAFELDDRGELVLTLERDPFEASFARAVQAFDAGDFSVMTAAAGEALAIRNNGPQAAYLRYVTASVANEPGPVLAALLELDAAQSAGQTIGLTRGKLTVELQRALAFCSKNPC